MLYINKITSDANQSLTLTGIAGIQITLTLRFMPRIQRWMLGISYGNVSIQGIAITSSVNMLRQFKNTIPFGIACLMPNGLDPYTINDFADQSANLYLLDASDVASIENEWFT